MFLDIKMRLDFEMIVINIKGTISDFCLPDINVDKSLLYTLVSRAHF